MKIKEKVWEEKGLTIGEVIDHLSKYNSDIPLFIAPSLTSEDQEFVIDDEKKKCVVIEINQHEVVMGYGRDVSCSQKE